MIALAPPASNSLANRIAGAVPEPRLWTIEDAYEFCERLARAHYENFPVGSILIPKNLREHVFAIYAFARVADDFADERYESQHSERERLELLDWWSAMLTGARQAASHPIFLALADTQSRFDIPIELFEDLLSAFRQDVTQRRYQTFDELCDYCRRSANPIGRLVLLLFGHREPQLHQWSDQICTALQLANHWQDVGVDLDKDRIYLPAEDLGRFNVSPERLQSRTASAEFKAIMTFEVDRARAMFHKGKPLCTTVKGRLGLELRATWLGGVTILNRIQANDYDVFANRPAITSADKLRILINAISLRGFNSQH